MKTSIILYGILIMSSILYSKNRENNVEQFYLASIQQIFMQPNNINTPFRTDGIFNYDWVTFPTKEAGLLWPVTSSTRKTADYASGIWIGAKVNSQIRLAACIYSSHYTPGNIPVIGQVPPASVCSDPSWRAYLVNLNDTGLVNGGTVTKTAGGRQYVIFYDAWANWPIAKGASYVEVNNIPGYQPGWNSDRPGIGNSPARPEEISFMVYMDYTNCTNNIHVSEISLPGGTLPIGVEIQQLSFAFNIPGFTDMYFMKWKIINKSTNTWDSTYISIVDDGDIGESFDDAAGCDSLRETGFIYNADNNDPIYGASPPAIGYRLLQSPLIYTGNPLDTARLPYGIYVGYKLIRLSSYNIFQNGAPDPCLNDPDEYNAGYNFMKGKDGCGKPIINYVTGLITKFKYSGDACNRVGWFDSISTDRRQILSCGPITMYSADTQIIVTSTMIAGSSTNFQSVCAVLASADLAKRYYDSNFVVVPPIGIANNSNEIPEKFYLYQNYPNPFNPRTKIKFEIPKSSYTKLIIYDILGREVTTLVNEQLKAGTYEVEWDGMNYTSGVYFYRIEAENFVDSKKMILLK